MAMRSALRIGRRKRSHQLDQDETRIPINRETAAIIAQRKKLFREQFGLNRGRMIHCFSSQASPFPNFSVMSPLMKYGRVYCRLLAILE